MSGERSGPITVGGRSVEPGERIHFRYDVGETYHGDSIEIPVSIINGDRPGPTAFFSAAVHGDEMNGVKIVQEIANRYEPTDLDGALVCLHVLNVPGFKAQERYLPIYDQDLNRSFPGSPQGTAASRLANTIFTEFVVHCDLGLDFHTSTRNRTTMYHVRADMDDPAVERLARSFGTNVILDGTGASGTLRSAACAEGVPTVTVEMGRARRLQTTHLGHALHCVASVAAEYGLVANEPVAWPGWTHVVPRDGQRTWIRAERAGLVEREWGPHPFVEAGDPLVSISDHFKEDVEVVRAPTMGIVIGVLENAVAETGHPLCHFVGVDDETARIIRSDIQRDDFPVYSPGGFHLPGEH